MVANTIEGLRLNQWGLEGVKATATLTVDVQPTVTTDTFTIRGVVYTIRASLTNPGDVALGGTLPQTQTNIVAAIMGTDGVNPANPYVTIGAFGSNVATLTAKIPGPGGNLITLAETFTAGTNVFSGAFMGSVVSGSFARGTPVAATSKMAVELISWGDDDENIYRPSIANGLLMRNRGKGTPVQHGTRFEMGDQPVVWEQLFHWLSMGIRGDVMPTGPAAGPFVWLFSRDPTINPNPAAWTFERRYSNGLGQNVDQRASYAMLSTISFTYAANEHLRMSAEGFARKFNTNAITGALTLPTPELGVSALSSVYVDSTWANIGNTLLAEQVIGWELEIGTGLMPLPTAEGRVDLDFTKHQINAKEVTIGLKLTLLLDPTTYAAEQAAAIAGTIRATRIKVTGSGGRLLHFDMLLQHTKPALFKIGEQDGQDIVELELEEATDNTNFLAVQVTHPTVATLA